MRTRFLLSAGPAVWLCLLATSVFAAPPPGYYLPAEGRTGSALRAALHTIVRGQHVIPYSSSSKTDTSDALKMLDRDPAAANHVLLVYNGVSVPASTFGSSGWNREHLWCDSYGLDGVEPAYADLHNLRACDANVNSSRGNKFYDVSNPADPGYKKPAHAEAPNCSTDSDSWEPPAENRGDIARALFYMTVRYTGDVAGEPRLRLTDATNLVSSATNYMGRFTTLLRWHFADPVSAVESNRNDLVYALYQANRNPFVDHPEYVAPAFIPPLQITRASTNLLLRWNTDYAPSFQVESAANLAGPWLTLTNTPVLLGNFWTITLPPGQPKLFYRTRLQ